jgi:group I intron endonuclease
MIGIYKITNPEGQIYIGLSTNILKRFKKYKVLDCDNQIKLKDSLVKFGVNNHKFEILEECLKENLFGREKYWIKKFNSFINGLNCNKGGGGIFEHSKETKDKISQKRKGWVPKFDRAIKIKNTKILNGTNILSSEHKDKIREGNRGVSRHKGRISPNLGNKYSKKTRLAISNTHKDKIVSKKTKDLMSASISKKCYQYDLEMNLIREWKSGLEAKQNNQGDVYSCLNGRQKTAGGFVWSYNLIEKP